MAALLGVGFWGVPIGVGVLTSWSGARWWSVVAPAGADPDVKPSSPTTPTLPASTAGTR